MNTTQSIEKVALEAPFIFKQMVAIEAVHPSKQTIPHRHDFYTILFVEAAKGIHHIDFKDYPLQSNTFYLLSPEQIHHLELTDVPKGQVLLFTTDFLQHHSISLDYLSELNLFFNCDEAPPISIPSQNLNSIKSLLAAIRQNYDYRESDRLEIIGAYLKILLLHLKRIKQTIDLQKDRINSRKATIVRAFKKDLEKHFKKHHKVSNYAQLQRLSSAYLNEVIKGETGSSVKDFIQKRLVLEAKRLALYSDWNMKGIAFHLGFEDSAHFSKLFKKQEGRTFSDFRKNKQ